ncbi:MAG: GntR family transcriptional regulator [Hydrogeniiclostridium sp.]|nr:GntR family transcriptional regulator [Clostridiales bacterium]
MNFDGEKPIYLQIAEQIEDAILTEAFPEETQIPSTTEISVTYKMNPATALKGINLLVDAGTVYKKRGLGMFVARGAKKKIMEKRKQEFYNRYIVSLLEEAGKLGISRRELAAMLSGEENNHEQQD